MSEPTPPSSDSISAPPSDDINSTQPTNPNHLPHPLAAGLKTSIYTGSAGLLAGSIRSVLVTPAHPRAAALAMGIKWALLGGAFWTIREDSMQLITTGKSMTDVWTPAFLREHLHQSLHKAVQGSSGTDGLPSSEDDVPFRARMAVGTAAGSMSFVMTGILTLGRGNILPGMLMGALFGSGFEYGYDVKKRWVESRRLRQQQQLAMGVQEDNRPFHERVLSSKWAPIRLMSDEEYANTLRERILRIDVDIALVNERIKEVEKLKEEEARNRTETKDNQTKSQK